MRLVVLDHLRKQSSAISLTDLEVGLQQSDRVTVYRTIKTFEEHGLVHRIENGSGTTKFALCADACGTEAHQDLHVHFYCTRCRETICLPKVNIPDVKLPDGFTPAESELIIKGICPGCTA